MVETVIVIYEENHGMLGVAKTYKDAVMFLINDHWLTDHTEVFTTDDGYETARLCEVFGEDWADIIRDEWDINTFNDYFCDWFSLTEMEIIDLGGSNL